MFIGDAEQKASGISPASVKGALRFWWRALMWGKILTDEKMDSNAALQALHQQESALFGSSADKGNAATFTLRVDAASVKTEHKTDFPKGGNDPSGYLGLGLWESGSHAKGNFQPHREYISENQTFSVTLKIQPSVSTAQQQTLKDALLAWGLFGGLGSRARRAFGSVAIQSIDNTFFTFSKTTDYFAAVNQLFATYRLESITQPPFTAFGKGSRFAINDKSEKDARTAHATLGMKFKDYRGQPSPLRGSVKRVFGMPYAGGTRLEGEARRASPLLFHVHPIGNQFVGALLFMPAHFHHDTALDRPSYTLARDFLDQLQGSLVA
ncbi:MAG: type III-B CRISPR module RAMP protein Cmr1 [Thiothrix lacustris]|uniref:Type III-B CRISPR module RAMP protein Cmr1 n=1 Tax=Thiothrix lacustris TaxID=525917 RepID=A0A1Y1QX09_9GAMM|nr:MAG: type III-B CRISPR module RAMP protein Cmr1 [Thiothrix lacustris]